MQYVDNVNFYNKSTKENVFLKILFAKFIQKLKFL